MMVETPSKTTNVNLGVPSPSDAADVTMMTMSAPDPSPGRGRGADMKTSTDAINDAARPTGRDRGVIEAPLTMMSCTGHTASTSGGAHALAALNETPHGTRDLKALQHARDAQGGETRLPIPSRTSSGLCRPKSLMRDQPSVSEAEEHTSSRRPRVLTHTSRQTMTLRWMYTRTTSKRTKEKTGTWRLRRCVTDRLGRKSTQIGCVRLALVMMRLRNGKRLAETRIREMFVGAAKGRRESGMLGKANRSVTRRIRKVD